MKALIYAGPKQAVLKDVPAPAAREGAVKVDVKYCGVCGSDIGIYLGTHPRAKAPLVFGHEFLGVVAEDGKKFKKGDRSWPILSSPADTAAPAAPAAPMCATPWGLIGIDVDGGMCEELYVDEDVLFKVPDGVSDRAAVVTEPLAVILRAVHQAEFKARDVAVVIGAGPIGMLTGIVLKNIGAAKVFISDVAEKRLAIAEELGLTPVNVAKEDLNEVVKAATGGEGCDVLFECSGSAQGAMDMTEITRVSGTICMVSVHKKPHEVNLQQLNFKEQWMIGTRVYTKEEFGQAVEYTKDLQEQLEKIVTHIVPMKDAERVFDMIADVNEGTVKVVVDCKDF